LYPFPYRRLQFALLHRLQLQSTEYGCKCSKRLHFCWHFNTALIVLLFHSFYQQMAERVQWIADDDSLVNDECFIMFIMSHGRQQLVESPITGEVSGVDYVYGTDGEQVSTNSLLAPLTNDNCRQLSSKPKLIFIQACRGGLMRRTYRCAL
jgi:Caspase domain